MNPKFPYRLKNAFSSLSIGLLLLFAASPADAQYSSATQYPFVSSTEEFKYLVGGTAVAGINVDDGQVANIPIGFSFPFCGTGYTTGSVSSNGWFSLSTTTAIGLGVNNDNNLFSQFGTNNSLPVMMPFWDDLGWVFGGNASYLTSGSAPNRVFTFEWRNWIWDFSLGKASLSMQMKLYENGSFQFLYKREGGPNGDIGSQLTLPGAWFGGSIGFARTLTELQFMNGTTYFSTPSTSAAFKTNMDSRPFSNQVYSWLAPCSNATSADIVAPGDVCPGKTFRIAAVTQPLALAGTVSWAYSEDGTSYIAISGNSGLISDAITKPRWYKATITCGSSSIPLPAKKVEISEAYQCLCDNGSTLLTSTAGSMDIGKVVVTTFTNKDTLIKNYDNSLALSNNLYSVKGYSDFTKEFSLPPLMYRDSTYLLYENTINWKTFTTGAVAAYIDFNHNAVYDPWELVASGASTSSSIPVPGQMVDTFTIPDSARIGLTRLRVILAAGTALPDSCGNYADGETEDYLININYPPCSGPANAGDIKGDTSMCPGYEYVLTDTTYEKLQGQLTRVWQHSADGIGWQDVSNSAAKDSIHRMSTQQDLQYRVRMICLATSDTSYTPVHYLKIKPAYKCYCYSRATGGNENDSSDIGAVKIYNFSIADGGAHLDNLKAVNSRTDRTDLQPIELMVDSLYSFYVYHTMPRLIHADAKVTIFMDFDNDHKYDIPSERVYTGFTNVGYHTIVNNVVVPNAAIVDVLTGMRVILNNEVAPNIPSDEACGGYISGETEDFMLIFRRPFNVGVKELKGLEEVLLFPNPSANGKFSLHFRSSLGMDKVAVKVMNITGQQVFSRNYTHAGGRFLQEIDLGSRPKGVYFVELDADGIKTTKKLVIQ